MSASHESILVLFKMTAFIFQRRQKGHLAGLETDMINWELACLKVHVLNNSHFLKRKYEFLNSKFFSIETKQYKRILKVKQGYYVRSKNKLFKLVEKSEFQISVI